MLDILDADIGGARVRRTFTRGTHRYHAGDYLSATDVLSMPIANRRALVDSQYLEVYPKYKVDTQRLIVNVGKNQFDVIEGFKLNKEPVSREEADKLLKG